MPHFPVYFILSSDVLYVSLFMFLTPYWIELMHLRWWRGQEGRREEYEEGKGEEGWREEGEREDERRKEGREGGLSAAFTGMVIKPFSVWFSCTVEQSLSDKM